MPTIADLSSVDYWQQRLLTIEDELEQMVGAVSGTVASFTIDQAETYKRLVDERAYCNSKIAELSPSSTAPAASFVVPTHSLYGS